MGAFHHCQFFPVPENKHSKYILKYIGLKISKSSTLFCNMLMRFWEVSESGWAYNDSCYWGHCPFINKALLGEVNVSKVFLSIFIHFCFLYDYAYEQPSLCSELVWYGTPIVVLDIDMLISIPKFNLSCCITV